MDGVRVDGVRVDGVRVRECEDGGATQPQYEGMSAVWSLVSLGWPPARLLVKVQTTKNPGKAGLDVGWMLGDNIRCGEGMLGGKLSG